MKGQRVMVLDAYVNGGDAEGVILREGMSKETKGKYIVDIKEAILPVEAERLVDAEVYWRQKRLDK